MEISYFVGAFVSQFALAALFHLILKRWSGGISKLAMIHTLAGVIGIVVSSWGHADGGALNFWDWPYRTIASAILFGLDILRAKGKKGIT